MISYIKNTTLIKQTKFVKFYVIGLVFVILSGIRISFLPEFQLLCFIGYVIYNRRLNYKVLLLLSTILCTHHYVIPDFVFRSDGSSYPSIYTRSYGGIKILDLLIIFLFLTSIQLFLTRNIFKIFYIKGLPTLLAFTSFIGCLFISSQQFSQEQFLFITRSYMLFFSIFIISINLSRVEFQNLSKLIIFCWILKMVISIIIPHTNPLTRPILGFNGIIFFAGDEYMTIPLYLSILILLNKHSPPYGMTYRILLVIFILTMIAQRKGAIQILVGFYALVFCYQHKSKFGLGLLKIYYIFSGYILFVFLFYIDKIIDNPLVLLAFDEYSNFANISIASLSHLLNNNFLGFIFGISPFGKYEIIGLPSYMDHMMSFGTEVGETFRYQFWVFPLGRCILNVGMLGFIYVFFKMCLTAKYDVFLMYLLLAAIPLCYFNNLTPVNAFAMGIVYAFLYNYLGESNTTKKIENPCFNENNRIL